MTSGTPTIAVPSVPDGCELYLTVVLLRCQPDRFDELASAIERERGVKRERRFDPSTGEPQPDRESVTWHDGMTSFTLQPWQPLEREVVETRR